LKKGVLYALGAYLIWGFLPIYWKLLQSIPSIDLAAHRMVWSLVFVAVVLVFKRQWQWLKPALTNKRTLLTFFTTGVLIGANWSIYIWAVNAGFIVETSLGYFINPLVSVTLGMIFFGERLRLGQGAAVAIAVAGVLYLTVSYGALPWIALSLALTFGFYGLLKKSTRIEALHGLLLEMSVVFLPALIYLFYRQTQGMGAFGQVSWWTMALLVGSGALTAIPLIFFANAAQQIPLSMVGLLFYLTPSMQFLIGVLVYGEPFTQARMIGFGLVWIALLLYSIEGAIVRRRSVAVQYAN
jgi:chloramphenicol-sensitive protein RarD